jgi:hypothetical protein
MAPLNVFARFDADARGAVIAAIGWAVVEDADCIDADHMVRALDAAPQLPSRGGRCSRWLPFTLGLQTAIEHARALAGDDPVTRDHLRRALS